MYSKNAWENYKDRMTEVMDFGEDYKKFITLCKTERLAVKEAVRLLEKQGFKDINQFKTLKTGDKVYAVNKSKNVASFIIGKKDITEGLRILGAHIDSPRLDLKQNPLYQDTDFALLNTHYYGGIKKYQWVTIPLSLIGVVCKKDGSTVDVTIGEGENDPVFG
ncbi:MAG: aminopeptidase, partial [Bacilli bacterium]